MSRGPTWMWRKDKVPFSVRCSWLGVTCAVQGHEFIYGEHMHGQEDWCRCERCSRFWHRDGCAARQCETEGAS